MKRKGRKYILWVVSILVLAMLVSAQLSMRKLKKSLVVQQDSFQELNEQLQNNLFLTEKAMADDLFFEGRMDEAGEIYLRISPDSTLWKERFGKLSEQEAEQMSWEVNMRILNRGLEKSLKELEDIKAEYLERTGRMEEELEVLRAGNDSLKRQVKNLNKELTKAKSANTRLNFSSKKNSTVQYVGEIENGKANGKGFGFWTTGSIYDGQWKENLRHGKGEFTWADGEKYQGEFAEDQREGFGIYYWKNGERYEGQWKEDRRNGEGTLYDSKGKVKYSGKWVNDEPASASGK